KLIALVVEHWLVVAGCWDRPRQSLRKSLRTVRPMALVFAGVLTNRPVLEVVLHVVVLALSSGNRIHKSAKDPRTWQILERPELCAQAYFPPAESELDPHGASSSAASACALARCTRSARSSRSFLRAASRNSSARS